MTTYIYQASLIVRGTGEGFSFATFAMWSALGWITAVTVKKGGGNPAIAIVYSIGATTTAIALLVKGRMGWVGQDTVVAILVVICTVLWMTLGSRPAFFASVASAFIAAVPFILLTWQNPGQSPIVSNSGFLLSNVLATAAAKSWKLEDWLYPGSSAVACFLLVLPWFLFR